MKIYLFGHTGFIGSWVEKYFSEKGYELQTIKVDITDVQQVREALKGVEGQIVINAAGKTGKPNVDWCEDHRLETSQVNITGAINVAQVASEQGNYVIHIGSGCIFQHRPPAKSEILNPKSETNSKGEISNSKSDVYAFTEEDEPNFFGSFYSQTKAVSESAVKEIPNVCVLRIRMPLQGESSPKNLLDKLLQYKKILNVPNSVTILEDFMPFLERVIEKKPTGVLNAVNPGVYEHRDLLELYREKIDAGRSFEYIGLEEFEGLTKAARSNCVLSTALCENLGIAMPPVSESLPVLVDRYKDSLGS